MIRLALLATAAVFSTVAIAQADVTTTQTQSIASSSTNFTKSVTFNKFDTTLGTLTGVTYTLAGGVQGTFKIESLDAAPATITGQLAATVTLTDPLSHVLAVALPTANQTFNATAFDNTIDFGGTSGVTQAGINQSANAVGSPFFTTAAAELALFTGPGTIILPVTATANSSATGAGNLVTQFATQASATVTVFYTYTAAPVVTPPPVGAPEPMSLALLGAGFVGLGLSRRVR